MDFDEHDALVKRLKLLSKTQTAFLKLYLHGKLVAVKMIVEESLQVIRKNSGRNPQLHQLGKELEELHIEDLEVDEAVAAVEAREEVAVIKKALSGVMDENVSVKVIEKGNDPPSSGSASNEEVVNLKTENEKMKSEIETLRGLLREAQGTLQSMKDSSTTQDSSVATAESKALALAKEIASLKSQLSERDVQISDLKSHVSRLEKSVEDASSGAGAAVSSMKTEYEEKMALQAKEFENRLETEKEEMMEAMAMEVEDVEKQMKANSDAAEAEKRLLNTEIFELRNALDKAQAGSSNLVTGLQNAGRYMVALKGDHRSLAKTIKKDLVSVTDELKATFGKAVLTRMKGILKDYDDLVIRYRKEIAHRKKLHNQIQELKGNIRVYMRARPPSHKELEQFGPDANCVTFVSEQEVKVLSDRGREKTWEFDRTFDMDSTQEEVYKEVSPLVISAIDGYAVCIFAYGQTGSGKTYTMNGPSDSRGVNTRALQDLFAIAEERQKEGWQDIITVSVLEVYNEEIHDLLSGDQTKLEIRKSAEGNYVPGLTSVETRQIEDVNKLMQVAEKHRSQQATNMNEHSSRSHMMLSVTIASHNTITGHDSRGRLHLVDLAGSERLNKTGAEGKALKEAQNINKSLSALGDVIQARANKQGHVPFRNSTLTYLLEDSLSADSKTLMFVCASPVIYNAEETYCSLNFASRVRSVELGQAKKMTKSTKK
jgi:kinesin family member C2/C3